MTALIGLVVSDEAFISNDVVFQYDDTSTIYTFSYNITGNASFESDGRFKLEKSDGTWYWNITDNEASYKFNITIDFFNKTRQEIKAKPNYLLSFEYMSWGYLGNINNLSIYKNSVYYDTISTDASGLASWTDSNKINSLTTYTFTYYPTTTTTTSTSTTSTTLPRNISSTRCVNYLMKGDVNNGLDCIYVNRDEDQPTMGKWFYLLVLISILLMMWLAMRTLIIPIMLLILIMGVYHDLFPPEASIIYWGVVVFGIAVIIWDVLKLGRE